MITKEVAERLFKNILESKDTLNNIFQAFQKEFDINLQYQILHLLSILLQNGVLSHESKLVTLYLMISTFPGPAVSNPYYSLFIFLYESRFESPNEFPPNFIRILENVLCGNPLEIGDNSVNEVFGLSVVAEQPKYQAKSDIKPSIIHVDNQVKDDPNAISYHDLIIILLTEVDLQQVYTPPRISDSPELFPYSLEEAQQFDTYTLPMNCFLYDDPKQYGNILFKRSHEQKLTDEESHDLVLIISASPEVLRNIDDKQLSFMIDNNPNVAKKYIEIWSKKKPQIFDTIASLPISLSEIEIVKFCSTLPNITQKFVDKWITNGMKTIDTENENSLMAEARMFCRLTSFIIQENANQIGQTVKMDLKSFCLILCSKGLAEAQELFERL
ncbi:hypothetical protein TVAG_088620 [Trichomonas vaginalis G3]|uniref:CCR4-NOT transcription complex subunit 11 n=1 Tax=Trichomonas vaginalis (strain ATCC PRA-98 / G3) TaxID=412133 RepID=A2EB07_TRIV3|nr:CCR4-NOT transcription complex subunit 11 family [Trichomonas vaginalis G3]EAY10147.1 hypothetical protein TVAG_088620 [Trichomonas vaginalis G3]KAI5534478.1 CCR4-NOT transcription complex subunit 11 family [Trichomonas vaginalis G3]|eukprot:XP_001322370.1 hypothetical protein [Trichomonas vaginalis G3]